MKKFIYTFFTILVLSGCENEEISKSTGTKLDYYIESYDVTGLGFTPQLKVIYQYNADKLIKYTVFSYSPDVQSLVEQRYFEFSYVNDQVSNIKGYLPDASSQYIEYSYQYSPDARVQKIIENNFGAGVNSEANFVYNDTDESIKVAYSYSNGASFEYELFYSSENILTDKTTRGEQLCSDGVYTYDQNKNPFNDLGYVDYVLSNLSANNKLTETVNYVGCAFPSIVPESYSYEYNDKGYPTVATTFYKSGGNVAKSEKKFFYR